MSTQTFREGDRVRVKPSKHLMPKFHGADGVIAAWCHDNIYRVKLDAFANDSVFNAITGGYANENRSTNREPSPVVTLPRPRNRRPDSATTSH